ncbi:MAG TPA: hypothetical protein VFD84_08985 [Candidatus Binatia bacterium]|jgi:hypothetical protein|nr:hypothetical protein [Candidatus Binatia bacterium]
MESSSRLRWPVRLATPLAVAALLWSSSPALPAGVSLAVGSVTVARSSSGRFAVTLTGTGVAGLQNDVAFDVANTPIAVGARGGPDCTSALSQTVRFAFLPAGCAGRSCTRMRAVITSLNGSTIPSGATLYTCRVAVPSTASAGSHALVVPSTAASPLVASSTAGAVLPLGASNGTVTVTSQCTGGCC